jgi:hypothetical protein
MTIVDRVIHPRWLAAGCAVITLVTLVRDVPIRSWTLFTLAAVTLNLDTVDGAVPGGRHGDRRRCPPRSGGRRGHGVGAQRRRRDRPRLVGAHRRDAGNAPQTGPHPLWHDERIQVAYPCAPESRWITLKG